MDLPPGRQATRVRSSPRIPQEEAIDVAAPRGRGSARQAAGRGNPLEPPAPAVMREGPLLWVRLGLAGGLMAPPLFVSATVAVTLLDKPFVDESGWSAVHRSEVGWPSVVMLGPNGWLVIVALVACGALVIGFASALWQALGEAPPMRVAAGFLGAAGLALCLVAFRQDPLGYEGPASWHDRIHNAAYPAIPIGVTLAAGLTWLGARRRPRWRPMPRFSLVTVAVAGPSFVLTGVDSIAQLARYPLFGSLLLWMEALAVTAARGTSGGRTDPRLAGNTR